MRHNAPSTAPSGFWAIDKEVIECLFKGINDNFDVANDPIATDGSSIERESDFGDLAGAGFPRDSNPDGMQTEFLMAVYQYTKIPFYVGAFSGEVSDEEQYAKSLPEILSLLDTGKMDSYAEFLKEWKPPKERKKNEQIEPFKDGIDLPALKRLSESGRLIIMDNGGSSKYNTDLICGLGHDFVTRKKLNKSDMDRIRNGVDPSWEYVEPGVWCTTTTYRHSGRATYLFFNEALYAKKRATAIRSFDKRMDATMKVMQGKIPKSDMVVMKHLPFVEYDVTVTVQSVLMNFTEEDKEREVKRLMGKAPGFFKLYSSYEMTPKEALDLYRSRTVIEHTISSVKQISGVKPLRVWRKESVIGSLVLALLVEAVLSMVRYDLKPVKKVRKRHGVQEETDTKPSTTTIKESLRHLTVTRITEKGGRPRLVYSNWEPLSTEIFNVLHLRSLYGRDWRAHASG